MPNETDNSLGPQPPQLNPLPNISNEVESNPPLQPSQSASIAPTEAYSSGTTEAPQVSNNLPETPISSSVVVGSAEPTLNSAFQSSPPLSPQLGEPIVGSVSNPSLTPPQAKTKKFRLKSKLTLVIVGVLVILGGSAAAAYFGYYMNPSTIWSDSLSNTANGYTKLVNYLNSQTSKHYAGSDENGTFNFNLGGKSYDGSLSAQSYNTNTTLSMKFDLGVGKVDLEERSIQPSGSTAPDLYVQLSGIKAIGSYLGTDLAPPITNLDGQWISIDHNLLNDLDQSILKNQAAQPTTSTPLNWAELDSFLQAEGKVNQKYLFSTNSSTAVMSVIQKFGMVSLKGHQTYHYKVAFNKTNVKNYIAALCSTLQQSSFGASLKQNLGQSLDITSTCTDLENSTKDISSSDDIDVWTDVNHRLIYQVQATDPSNPAQSFVDFGLDYKGGDSYPFFISAQAKDGSDNVTYSVIATLNTASDAINVKLNGTSTGTDQGSLSANLSVHPTTTKPNIVAPANAEPITTILNNLGLGQFLQGIQSNANTVEFLSPISNPDTTKFLLSYSNLSINTV